MADEKTGRQAALEKLMYAYLEKGAERDFKPYTMIITESLGRCMKLVTESDKVDKDMASEILRAAVVQNHAYLEDFMRTLALAFLPTADENVLDDVPLAGLGQANRAEKFYLGKLTRHRGKTVNDLISESVTEHMERSSFNSVTEIMSFLRSIGLKLPDGKDESPESIPKLPVTPDILAILDQMMKRRHQIVHRADKAKSGGLEAITAVEVMRGIVATLHFTLSTAHTAFLKRHSFEEFKKKVDALRAAYEKAINDANRTQI